MIGNIEINILQFIYPAEFMGLKGGASIGYTYPKYVNSCNHAVVLEII